MGPAAIDAEAGDDVTDGPPGEPDAQSGGPGTRVDGHDPQATESDAQPGGPDPGAAGPEVRPRPIDTERSVDARLARLHLRGGLLALARAELEQMAGAGTLDLGALADLAEVRWRNGDLMGAAEAASAHLDSGGEEPMAMIICAEALDHDGHLLDARAMAARALGRVGGQVERMFAGEARSSAWSSAGSTPLPLARGTMTWGGLAGGAEVHDPQPSGLAWAPGETLAAETPEAETPTAGLVEGQTVGEWASDVQASAELPDIASTASEPRPGTTGGLAEDDPAVIAAGVPGGSAPVPPLPGSIAERVESGRAAGKELGSIEEAIASGRLTGVPERLGLLLRADRALAPIILTHADRALAVIRRNDPAVAALHLVRGDAYRALGRESDATAAFQQSLRAVAARTTDKESQ